MRRAILQLHAAGRMSADVTKHDELLADALSSKFADQLRCAVPCCGCHVTQDLLVPFGDLNRHWWVVGNLRLTDELLYRSHIKDSSTQPPENYGGRWNVLRSQPVDHGTCHFNVVDKQGMAIAMTTTVSFVRHHWNLAKCVLHCYRAALRAITGFWQSVACTVTLQIYCCPSINIHYFR